MEFNHRLWAEAQWGQCKLGDVRRTRRAVMMGARMAADPAASLPQQMGDWATLLGAYRLLNNPAVSLGALVQPHCQATQQASAQLPLVLLVQDRTAVDYSQHPATTGLGPLSKLKYQHGLLVHSTLAVNPAGQQILGLANVQCWVRPPAGTPRSKTKRRGGQEGYAWEQAVAAIGPVPAQAQWVYVSDRESDIYEYLLACRAQGAGFVVRAYQDRVLADPITALAPHLLPTVRAWPPATPVTYTVTVAATARTPQRVATLHLSWQTVALHPPKHVHKVPPLTVTVVRAWEPDPPLGSDAVEWILFTSETVCGLANAQRVVAWYECRWLIEDLHQCLKTGCRVEHAQLDDGQDLQRLLGFALPIAMRLLQLRQSVRVAPTTPAAEAVEPQRVQLLAAHFQRPALMTVAEFWQLVARLGGHLGRKSDGPPGWRTLWRGWLKLDQWLYAAQWFT